MARSLQMSRTAVKCSQQRLVSEDEVAHALDALDGRPELKKAHSRFRARYKKNKITLFQSMPISSIMQEVAQRAGPSVTHPTSGETHSRHNRALMSSQKLDDLSEQLDRTLDRINQLEKKPSWRSRISNHFRTQSSSMVNVVLAGCVLSVAIGRLVQQNRHEEYKQQWTEEKKQLELEKSRLLSKLSDVETDNSLVRKQVERELEGGGWRLAPVAARIRTILQQPQSQPVVTSRDAGHISVPEKIAPIKGRSETKLMI